MPNSFRIDFLTLKEDHESILTVKKSRSSSRMGREMIDIAGHCVGSVGKSPIGTCYKNETKGRGT